MADDDAAAEAASAAAVQDDDYDDDGFADYISTARDPGPWALFVATVICVFVLHMLPFALALRQRLKERRQKKKENEDLSADNGNSHVDIDPLSGDLGPPNYCVRSPNEFFALTDEECDEEYPTESEPLEAEKADELSRRIRSSAVPGKQKPSFHRVQANARVLQRVFASQNDNQSDAQTAAAMETMSPNSYQALGDEPVRVHHTDPLQTNQKDDSSASQGENDKSPQQDAAASSPTTSVPIPLEGSSENKTDAFPHPDGKGSDAANADSTTLPSGNTEPSISESATRRKVVADLLTSNDSRPKSAVPSTHPTTQIGEESMVNEGYVQLADSGDPKSSTPPQPPIPKTTRAKFLQAVTRPLQRVLQRAPSPSKSKKQPHRNNPKQQLAKEIEMEQRTAASQLDRPVETDFVALSDDEVVSTTQPPPRSTSETSARSDEFDADTADFIQLGANGETLTMTARNFHARSHGDQSALSLAPRVRSNGRRPYDLISCPSDELRGTIWQQYTEEFLPTVDETAEEREAEAVTTATDLEATSNAPEQVQSSEQQQRTLVQTGEKQQNLVQTDGQQQTPIQTDEQQQTPVQTGEQQPFEKGTIDPATNFAIAREREQTIDICCGKRPWVLYFFSRGFLRKLRKCASYDNEMRRIGKLAIPYALQASAIDMMYILEIAAIGNLFGTDDLSAYVTVEVILALATMMLNGIVSSLTVLCSHAMGANNIAMAGKFVQLAVVTYQIILTAIVIPLWNKTDNLVKLFGFDESTAQIAQDYARFIYISYLIGILDTGLHYVLEVAGHERYTLILNSCSSASHFVCVLLVASYIDRPALWMVGALQLLVTIGALVVNVVYVVRKEMLVGIWEGIFGTVAFFDRRALQIFITTASPLAFGYVIEYCEWEILFFFASRSGPAEAAVWGLLGSLWGVAENITLSLGSAAEVRVGHLLASNRPGLARYSAHKSTLLGGMLSIAMAMTILGLKDLIPLWLTQDETLREIMGETLPLVCLGLIVLNFGSMSWAILCAQGRTLLATSTTFFGTIFITLPLASIVTFALNVNLKGLLAAVVVGYSCSGFVNSFVMIVSKWDKLAEAVSKQHNKEGGARYDNYYWDELPPIVEDAAVVLGYNQRTWDHSVKIAILDVPWPKMSEEQQEAARTMGYDEEKWKLVCKI